MRRLQLRSATLRCNPALFVGSVLWAQAALQSGPPTDLSSFGSDPAPTRRMPPGLTFQQKMMQRKVEHEAEDRWERYQREQEDQRKQKDDGDAAGAILSAVVDSSTADGKPKGPPAAPLLFRVPAPSSRVLGREHLIMLLWQALLAGKRVQIITGIDGMGKSTLAAAFCEACRRSNRFSLIHYFSARQSLDQQMQKFFSEVKTRLEREVLLVFDNITNIQSIAPLIPPHPSVHVLVLCATEDLPVTPKFPLDLIPGIPEKSISISAVEPLSDAFAAQLMEELPAPPPDMAVRRLNRSVAGVPLLLRMANCILRSGPSPDTFETLLEKLEGVLQEGDLLSMSAAVKVLVDFGFTLLEERFGRDAGTAMQVLSLCNIDELNPELVHAAGAECNQRATDAFGASTSFAEAAIAAGLLFPQWVAEGCWIHSTVAEAIRGPNIENAACKAIKILLGLWPRRMRGEGLNLAAHLARHAAALHQALIADGAAAPLASTELAADLFDKAATFLAHVEGQDLRTAASLWSTVRNSHQVPKTVRARAARELSKAQLKLRDSGAEASLRAAAEVARATYGNDSVEAAVALSCLCEFLQESEVEEIRHVQEGIVTLRNHLINSRELLSPEEALEVKQALFILLISRARFQQAATMEPVPQAAMTELEVLQRDIMKGLGRR